LTKERDKDRKILKKERLRQENIDRREKRTRKY
jgi:hypothetical protein